MCHFYLTGLSSVPGLNIFFFLQPICSKSFPSPGILCFSKPSPPFRLLGFLFFQEVSGTFPVVDHPPSEHLYHSFIHTICEAGEC